MALFLQLADPALYPPIMHAALIMAENGWKVKILSSPQHDIKMEFPAHPGIETIKLRTRPSYRVLARDYLAYITKAIVMAFRFKPDVIYASDPLGSIPGMLAFISFRSRLVYHEHDSPTHNRQLMFLLRVARKRVAQMALIVVFPNSERADIVREQLGFCPSKIAVIWNLPSRRSIPPRVEKPNGPLVFYYHGSITPERLPRTVPEAIARLRCGGALRIAGYEVPSAQGYINELQSRWGRVQDGGLIDFIGQLSHPQLLREAAKAHIGIALMPHESADINMKYMSGASNKAFDYMAAEMPLLVSELPEWRKMFVDPGYAVACDPDSVDSVERALAVLVGDSDKRKAMAKASREKIDKNWHYEAAFCQVLSRIEADFACEPS